MNDTKFFTNEPNRDLYGKFQSLLRGRWGNISTDPKLVRLKKLLRDIEADKKIIFTESKETAQYLKAELGKVFGDRIILFSGDSSRSLKERIEQNFNPQAANPENNFDLLISTDVLAEGVNLHRANVLINYDLPWNPTRIMQRVGRINRIGTKHAEIFVFNFFPAAETKKHLSLEERITEKLQLFHNALGEDFKYISEDEEVSPKKLFSVLNTSLDDGEVNPEAVYLNLIRTIRDTDKALFGRISRLPRRTRAGKFSDKVSADSTLTFMRRGDIPAGDLKKIRQLKGSAPQEMFGKIKAIIGEFYLNGRNYSDDADDKKIILSCSLRRH